MTATLSEEQMDAPTVVARPWERRSEKVQSWQRDRLALVYVRQSTPQQVHDHQESTRLQYGLTGRAQDLGDQTFGLAPRRHVRQHIGEQSLEAVVAVHAGRSPRRMPWPSGAWLTVERSAVRPRARRDFAVPWGMSRMSAASVRGRPT